MWRLWYKIQPNQAKGEESWETDLKKNQLWFKNGGVQVWDPARFFPNPLDCTRTQTSTERVFRLLLPHPRCKAGRDEHGGSGPTFAKHLVMFRQQRARETETPFISPSPALRSGNC